MKFASEVWPAVIGVAVTLCSSSNHHVSAPPEYASSVSPSCHASRLVRFSVIGVVSVGCTLSTRPTTSLLRSSWSADVSYQLVPICSTYGPSGTSANENVPSALPVPGVPIVTSIVPSIAGSNSVGCSVDRSAGLVVVRLVSTFVVAWNPDTPRFCDGSGGGAGFRHVPSLHRPAGHSWPSSCSGIGWPVPVSMNTVPLLQLIAVTRSWVNDGSWSGSTCTSWHAPSTQLSVGAQSVLLMQPTVRLMRKNSVWSSTSPRIAWRDTTGLPPLVPVRTRSTLTSVPSEKMP